MNPYPPIEPVFGRLDISCQISTPTGWLELNRFPYRLHDGSFSTKDVSFRKDTAQSSFLEGTNVNNALRENVVETLVVRVEGTSVFETERARQRLEEAVSQVAFRLVRVVDTAQTLWSCYASDYRIEASRELQHARMCLVRISLERDPYEEIGEVL